MSDFARQLDEAYNRKVLGTLDKVVRVTAINIDRDLVLETPVGDPSQWQNPNSAPPGYVGGRARSNWLPSINSPVTRATDETAGAPSVETVLAQFNVKDTIYLSNNVPYIKRLNEGHSKQAPSGFIDDIISRHRNAISGVVRDITRGML